jgi:hypothetical protein
MHDESMRTRKGVVDLVLFDGASNIQNCWSPETVHRNVDARRDHEVLDKTTWQAHSSVFIGWLFAVPKSNDHDACKSTPIWYAQQGGDNSHRKVDF